MAGTDSKNHIFGHLYNNVIFTTNRLHINEKQWFADLDNLLEEKFLFKGVLFYHSPNVTFKISEKHQNHNS